MKLLHIMPYPPTPPTFGGAIRMFHLLKNIAREHDVTVLSFGRPDAPEVFRKYFDSQIQGFHVIPARWGRKYQRLVQFYSLFRKSSYLDLMIRSEKMQELIDRTLTHHTFDIVQTEFSSMGRFRLNTDAIKILDAHNVEYDFFRRMALLARSPIRKLHYYQEHKKFYREEVEACAKQDAVFVTSERDRKILDFDVPQVPKFVVPNGVDSSYFTPSSEPPEPTSLVFTGSMGYIPNYDGMVFFLDEIFPLIWRKIPDVKIYIVGNRPPRQLLRRATDRVVVTGFVDDVRPYISRASVYVVPLRIGGGTRLKVVEAMAMGKPIVTTSIGSEGIDVQHRESGLVADEPASFADAVAELLCDVSLRQKLVRNAYELVRSRYEWSVITRQVEDCYQALLHKAGSEEVLG